jgi:hypothetical protein
LCIARGVAGQARHQATTFGVRPVARASNLVTTAPRCEPLLYESSMEDIMTRVALAAIACGLVLLTAPALAQDAAPVMPPPTESGRYAFERVPEGFMRLDRHTGHVSLCAQRAAGWTCSAVADERAALESEIGRLQGEVGRLQSEVCALRKELLARGPTPGDGKTESVPPVAGAPDKAPETPRMPTDADIERVKSFIENVWRRLVEMMANMQRDMQRKS